MNGEELALALSMGATVINDAGAECTTVRDYSRSWAELYKQDPEKAMEVWAQYEEIIKDELNHALRFILKGYCAITEIEPNTDGLDHEEGED